MKLRAVRLLRAVPQALLFIAAFSLAPNPGRHRVVCMPCSGLHPQGFTVPSAPVHLSSAVWFCIITPDRPCRFCAIAVTLATPALTGLRTRLVEGLSSATGISCYRQPQRYSGI